MTPERAAPATRAPGVGPPPERGAAKGEPAEPFSALLDLHTTRTAPAEGHKETEPKGDAPASDGGLSDGQPTPEQPVQSDGLPVASVAVSLPVEEAPAPIVSVPQPAEPVAPQAAQPAPVATAAPQPVAAQPAPVATEAQAATAQHAPQAAQMAPSPAQPAPVEAVEAAPQAKPGDGMPAKGATPATPATPAEPSWGDGPARPATPATPATPAQPKGDTGADGRQGNQPDARQQGQAPEAPGKPVAEKAVPARTPAVDRPAAPAPAPQAAQAQPAPTQAAAQPADAAQPAEAPQAAGQPRGSVRLAETVETVKATLRMSVSRGVSHARLALNPAELGGVEVQLRSSSAGLVARVVADSPEAARLLSEAAADLRRTLESQGIEVLRLDVETAPERRAASGAFADGREPGSDRPGAASRSDNDLTDPDERSERAIELPNGVLVDVLA